MGTVEALPNCAVSLKKPTLSLSWSPLVEIHSKLGSVRLGTWELCLGSSVSIPISLLLRKGQTLARTSGLSVFDVTERRNARGRLTDLGLRSPTTVSNFDL